MECLDSVGPYVIQWRATKELFKLDAEVFDIVRRSQLIPPSDKAAFEYAKMSVPDFWMDCCSPFKRQRLLCSPLGLMEF